MTAHTIVLRFVREAGLVSWAIDRLTGGFLTVGPRWSHVGIMIGGWELRGFGLEPDQEYEFGARNSPDQSITGRPGVQFRAQGYARFADNARVHIPVSADEHQEFWRLARKVNGAGYSRRTIAGFVIGRNIPEDLTPDHPRLAFDCSTLVAWLLLHAGLMPQEFHYELRQISPNALYDIARMIAWYRRDLLKAVA